MRVTRQILPVLFLSACTAAPTPCSSGLLLDSNGVCVPKVACGSGTQETNGECTPTSTNDTTCGSGTTLQGNACVAELSCGTGTQQSGSACVASLSCGTGTQQSGDACVGTLSCGAGTSQTGSSCTSTLTCAPGTSRSGNSCYPNLTFLCGTDTTPANGGSTCVSALGCGANTLRQGNSCVGVGGTCGTGTLLQNGACVVPTPVTGLTSFMRQTGLRSASHHVPSMFVMGFTTPSSRDMILTDFAQVLADAFVTNNTAPVGTGTALHFATNDDSITSRTTFTVINDVQTDGGCKQVAPGTGPSFGREMRLQYGTWSSTQFTRLACGQGGVIVIEPIGGNLQLTFNAQLSDGTLLQNEMLTLPY